MQEHCSSLLHPSSKHWRENDWEKVQYLTAANQSYKGRVGRGKNKKSVGNSVNESILW